MSNNEPDYTDNLYFDCKNCKMTDEFCASGECPTSQSPRNDLVTKPQAVDLTEKWKKGELHEGYYYIKTRNETNIDEYIQWYKDHGIPSEKSFAYFNVQQVLAEVPDYVEWRNMVNCACEEHEANKRLLEENAQLKDMLKECKGLFNRAMVEGAEPNNAELIEILTKIDEVLK